MRPRTTRLIFATLTLAFLAALFLFPQHLTEIRAHALLSQLSSHIGHLGPKIILTLLFLLLTAFLGRFFCSILCPAGLVQELFHRLGGLLHLRRLSFKPRAPRNLLLAGLALVTALGFIALVNFLDPLGLFGRLLAAFHPAPPPVLTGPPPPLAWEDYLLYALAILGAVLLIAVPLRKGRWFCDRACPIGALLGVAAELGGNRGMRIEGDKCGSCSRCEKFCPVRTIDSKGKSIDASRCVLCLDCMKACPVAAIAYHRGKQEKPDKRRNFLQTSLAAAAAGCFVLARPLGGALGWGGERPTAVTPPGSGGDISHETHCMSCQSCVLACPVGIIQIQGPDLRPVMDYDRGYCQYECADCTKSCPAGALKPLALERKKLTRLAETKLFRDRCVVITEKNACGACAEVCPTHAVRMQEAGEGRPTEPDFAAEFCIGCGACYHVCPAEPRAFTVTGLPRHELAQGVRPGGHTEVEEMRNGTKEAEGGLQDFPF